MTRTTYRSAVALTALGAFTASSAMPAPAGRQPTQTVIAEIALKRFQIEPAEVCLANECETVTVTGNSQADLQLRLSYTLASTFRLPNIEVQVGWPQACRVRNVRGTASKRPGASIFLSGAKVTDGSSLELVKDGQTVMRLRNERKPLQEETDSQNARICLTALQS